MNNKTLIIVDTFSGLNEKKANELGFWYLPQIIIIDGKTFKDGIEIFNDKDFKMLENGKDLKTSMPPIGLIMDMFEKASKEYENVFFFPLNKGMSSTSSSAHVAAKDYENIHIFDSKLTGTALVQTAQMAKKMADDGKSIDEIKKAVKNISDKSYCYIIPKDIKNIIKSGRIAGITKTIMEKAKLIPKTIVTNDGLKTLAIKRNFAKTIKNIISRLSQKIDIEEYEFELLQTGLPSSNEIVHNAFRDCNINANTIWVPTVVAAHLGIGGIGINAWPKIKYT